MFEIFKKKKDYLKIVNNKKFLIRLIALILACFVTTFNYNAFLVPNNIVMGGMSGLAIVIKELTGLSTTIFLNITNIILIIVSLILLGKGKTLNTILGTIIYTLMISITSPLAKMINLNIESNIVLILIAAILNGLSGGIIYRAGFNTGGSDVLIAILNKFLKVSMGEATKTVNTTIIILGAVIFDFTKTICAIAILTISVKIVDIVMLGINDSKMCFIKSKDWNKVEKFLTKDLNIGVTEISASNGLFNQKDPTLLVIVPFNMYYGMKKQILEKDPYAFIASHDCYAVTGGYEKTILPF